VFFFFFEGNSTHYSNELQNALHITEDIVTPELASDSPNNKQ